MMKREKLTGMQDVLSRPVVMGLLALFCCALWGSAFSCIKIGYRLFQISAGDTGSVILFAGLRFALAGIMVILAGSALQGRRLVPQRDDIAKIAKLCAFQTVFQYFFFYIGLAHASGVKSAIITGSNSLLTILMSSLVFRQEKLTPAKAAGCLLGFLGVAAANLTGGGMHQNASLLGEGFVFLSAVSYAFSSALIKRYSADSDPVLLSGWQFLAGGAVLAAGGLALGGSIRHASYPAAAMLLYLGFLSAAAYTVWGLLLKYNPVSRVSIYGFSNPVVGVVLSALLLGEGGQAFSARNVAALLLVSGGIFVVNHSAFAGGERRKDGMD
ncbi:DMT family transporter [Otoolea muris]|uniref:DMT family transporter n=1 Tax=Otoolea muris TaxID=2941515 RepID=UPI00203EF50F|nr:DMT family transporter [Otoolea muris]